MINAGDLNKRITIQAKTVTRDSYGAETIVYTNIATIWANIQIITGKEFFNLSKRNSEIDGIIKIRYRKSIKPDMRIIYCNKTFDILSIINSNEDYTVLELHIKEVI